MIENHGFTFIRINSDLHPVAVFDLDVEIAKIYNYIYESFLKLPVNPSEKSLKEKFGKELLSYMSSISKRLNYIKNTTYLKKKAYRFKLKEKPKYVKKKLVVA